jgi:hypothetical protein
VTAQQMRVAGYPRIEPKTTESTTHLEFTAIFETTRNSPRATCPPRKSSAPPSKSAMPRSTRPSTSCASSASPTRTPTARPPRIPRRHRLPRQEGRRAVPGRPGHRLPVHPRPGPDAG